METSSKMADGAMGDTRTAITREAIDEMKARVGMVMRPRVPFELTTEAHIDTMRRYAMGIGDDNPLWCDPEYGKSTRWNGTIAFPTYNVGGLKEQYPEHLRFVPRGDPLKGLQAFQSGVETTYYRPIYVGDRASTLTMIESVEEKESSFGGISVHVTRSERTRNQRGDIVKVRRTPFIHTGREAARKKKKLDLEKTVYTDELLARIDADYAAELRRGAEPRFWEDVSIGDIVPQVTKAMFTIEDWIGYCVGAGTFGAFGTAPWRLDYLNRQRIPKFYMRKADGIPRSAWAVHVDDAYAKSVGVPAAYDNANMREAFLTHFLTNWAGDDGFVFKTCMEMRKFNYFGDTQWCRGRVTGKRREGNLNIVDIEMRCENQRGEITTPGSAVVLLPSREFGPVRLPAPPEDIL